MSVSPRLRRRILERDNFTCQYCGWAPEIHDATTWADLSVLHIDHMVPIAKDGRDDEDNLVVACYECNLSKGARIWPVPKAQCVGCGEWFEEPDEESLCRSWGTPCYICPDCVPTDDFPPVDEIALELAQWDALIADGWDVR